MSKRNISFIIVCEDQQQESFTRRYLKVRGFNPRKFRVERSPKGKGAGELFVRTQLIKEIKEFRRNKNRTSNAIVAMIDADIHSVDERMQQINSHLKTNGLEPIQMNEKIAVFIPKRNIETWIYFAQGTSVNETASYPKLQKPGGCQSAVDQLLNNICKNGIPENAPPSLIHACAQLQKIV